MFDFSVRFSGLSRQSAYFNNSTFYYGRDAFERYVERVCVCFLLFLPLDIGMTSCVGRKTPYLREKTELSTNSSAKLPDPYTVNE